RCCRRSATRPSRPCCSPATAWRGVSPTGWPRAGFRQAGRCWRAGVALPSRCRRRGALRRSEGRARSRREGLAFRGRPSGGQERGFSALSAGEPPGASRSVVRAVCGTVPCRRGNRRRPVPKDRPVAVEVGFEPTEGRPSHAFEACALGRYATPPRTTLPDTAVCEELDEERSEEHTSELQSREKLVC